MFTSDPGQPATLHQPFHPSPPPPKGKGETSMASPHAYSTWAGVVKGHPPPPVSPGPSPPPSAHLLQLYKDCVARGIWARLIFETKGGEEELSFLCRVPVGASTTRAAYGARADNRARAAARRPANERRRNGQGGEGKPGRREGGPLQQPLPPAAVEEEQLAKEEQKQRNYQLLK